MSPTTRKHIPSAERTDGEIQFTQMSRAQRALAAAQGIARTEAESRIDQLAHYLENQKNVTFVICTARTNAVHFGPTIDVVIKAYISFMYDIEVSGGHLQVPTQGIAQGDTKELRPMSCEIEARIKEISRRPHAEFAVMWHVVGDSQVHFEHGMGSDSEWLAEIADGLASWAHHDLWEAVYCAFPPDVDAPKCDFCGGLSTKSPSRQ